ncbi:Sec7-domain-containing protein [Basidiobolus meristosporus CBS 931.73]|uniref:Sec7-domain-containing protein n=1 Tax=Basidiobolus meristosporus CBS 931.73 TaxID=1314790 RepID=A0A1Y1Z8J6_9FUNG|nr:Sec7-domain-containing protein [Basidiobolus meristosporus CBS 931.73]|eukprot:ORY06583.1 Sec7-domain-containing protein [Basidiobolus meristosporus CBS 931.73]
MRTGLSSNRRRSQSEVQTVSYRYESSPTPLTALYELNWLQIVHSEITAVTAVMRKNSRWSSAVVANAGEVGNLGRQVGLRSFGAEELPKTEHSLIRAFFDLQANLINLTDVCEMDALTLLSPFLAIVRSGDTTGPITGTALDSLDKFISYGIIGKHSPNLPQAMAELSSAVTHCKFEATDSASDEAVLLKILQLLKITITCEAGALLNDESICEIMETALSMCCQMRLSELLRRSAEQTILTMVQCLFRRLDSLSSEAQEDTQNTSEKSDSLESSEDLQNSQELRVNLATSSSDSSLGLFNQPHKSPLEDVQEGNERESIELTDANEAAEEPLLAAEKTLTEEAVDTKSNSEGEDDNEDPKERSLKPFGLPSIRELMRVLISLLNSQDRQYTDTMRQMALNILNKGFEVAGRTIGRFEVLRAMVSEELCKYLFQLVQTDNVPLLASTLRLTMTIFHTLGEHLKLQLEFFLKLMLDRLSPPNVGGRPPSITSDDSATSRPVSPSFRERTPKIARSYATGEIREILLECLGQFTHNSSFMIDLWVNFDCDVESGDIFEDLINFLCKNSLADPAVNTPYSSQLCLNNLLMYTKHVLDRNRITSQKDAFNSLTDPIFWIQGSNAMTAADTSRRRNSYGGWENKRPVVKEGSSLTFIPSHKLLELKRRKQLLLRGAAEFNENPKTGIQFLYDNGILPPIIENPTDEEHLTIIKNLANFLKTTPTINKKLLGEYLSKPVNREVLKSFIELFQFKNKRIDEAMREMLETFRLPGEAQQIERIVETFATAYFASEPEEVASQDGAFVLSFSVIMLNTDLHNPQVKNRMSLDDYMKNLRSVNNGRNFSPEYLGAIYKAISKKEIIMPDEHEGQLGFEYAWKELVQKSEAGNVYITRNTPIYDKDMFLSVWKQIVAAYVDVFDSAQDDVMIQKAITGLLHCALIAGHFQLIDILDYLTNLFSGLTGLLDEGITVNPENNRAVNSNGTELVVSDLALQFGRNYKGQLATIIAFGLADELGNSIRDGWKQVMEIVRNLFLSSLLPVGMLETEDFLHGTITIPIKLDNPDQAKPEQRESSIFSTLSSYLLPSYSSSYEFSWDEPLEILIECTRRSEECVAACKMEELFANIRFLEMPALKSVLHSLTAISSIHDPNTSPKTLKRYEPVAVFCLELTINITIQNRDRIQEIWPITLEYLSQILSRASDHHVMLVERSVIGLLRLCIRLVHKDEMIDEIFQALKLISDLPNDILNLIVEQAMCGLLSLVKAQPSCVTRSDRSITVLTLFSLTVNHSRAAKYSFEALKLLTTQEYSPGASYENFKETVSLLLEFVQAGSNALNGQKEVPHHSPKMSRNRIQSDFIERALNAVEMLYKLYIHIPALIKEKDISIDQAWPTYCLPILDGLSQQCCHPCREIRLQSLAYLQRALVLPELSPGNITACIKCFDEVIFPLLSRLLEPEVYALDPHNMDETRLRAAGLLSTQFLHQSNLLGEWDGLISLWSKILDLMILYLHAGETNYLLETIPESLKNMLLVMSAAGLLQPEVPDQSSEVRSEQQINLWNVTWEKLNQHIPGLREELFPAPKVETASAPRSDEDGQANKASEAPVLEADLSTETIKS